MSKTVKRTYTQFSNIESDLFRLKIADAHKNVAWDDNVRLEKVPHVHFFRTYDSDGRKLTQSASVGGHFHVIEYDDSKDSTAKIKSISGPMHMVKRKIKGQWKSVAEPLPASLDDNHTHEFEYIMSVKLEARQQNPAAVQLIAADAIKTQPIPGVS